jgi:excisionase family DNA binding protein
MLRLSSDFIARHHMDNPEVYLTPRDAAEYLRISTSTLAKLRVYGGGLKFTKVSRSAVRYRLCDLDAYMAARRVTSTSENPEVTADE